MKDIYTLLNEALAKLKEASASKYDEVATTITTLDTNEAKLNCVEEALKASVKESASTVLGLSNIEESKKDYSVLFGVEARPENIEENQPGVIKKNNGASHNGHGEPIVEVDRTVAKKETLVKFVMGSSNITEAEARVVLGLKPKGPEGLTRKQQAEYAFARAIGISESDSLKLAKLTDIREVNSNPRY